MLTNRRISLYQQIRRWKLRSPLKLNDHNSSEEQGDGGNDDDDDDDDDEAFTEVEHSLLPLPSNSTPINNERLALYLTIEKELRAGQSRDPRTADMGHSLLDQGVCGQLNFRMDRRCVVALRTRSCRGASSASPFSTPTAQCGRCPVAAAGRDTSTGVSESERAARVAVDGAPARTLGSMSFAS